MSTTLENTTPAHTLTLTLDRAEREALSSRLIAYADETNRWLASNDSAETAQADDPTLSATLRRRQRVGTDSCRLLADRLVWNGDLDLGDRVTRLDVADALTGWPADDAPDVPASLQRVAAAVEAVPARPEWFTPYGPDETVNLATPEGRARFEQQLREDQRTDLWYVVGQYADEHAGQLVRAASAEQQRRIRDGQPAPSVDVIAWGMAYKAVKDQVTVDRLTSAEIAATLEDLRTISGPSLMPRSPSDTGPTVSPTPAIQGPAHSL